MFPLLLVQVLPASAKKEHSRLEKSSIYNLPVGSFSFPKSFLNVTLFGRNNVGCTRFAEALGPTTYCQIPHLSSFVALYQYQVFKRVSGGDGGERAGLKLDSREF